MTLAEAVRRILQLEEKIRKIRLELPGRTPRTLPGGGGTGGSGEYYARWKAYSGE